MWSWEQILFHICFLYDNNSCKDESFAAKLFFQDNSRNSILHNRLKAINS